MSNSELTKLTYSSDWSQYDIDYYGYLVFRILQQNPLLTMSSIAEKIGVSITVIKSRIQELKDKGFLRQDQVKVIPFLGKRTTTEVEAIYEPKSLGLTKFHVILHNIRDEQSFLKLDRIIQAHPYSRYSSGSFTSGASIYCQFDIPKAAKKHLKQLFKNLQNDGLVGNYTMFSADYAVESNYDFSNWDFASRRWITHNKEDYGSLNLETDLDLFLHDAISLSMKNQEQENTSANSVSHNFDELDLKLIRELNVNAKITTVELSKYYDVNQSTISRRINAIKSNFIRSNLLYFDYRIFNLEYPTLFYGSYDKNSEFDSIILRNLVLQTGLPFQSFLTSSKNQYFWLVNLPYVKIVNLSKFLWKHSRKVEIYPLDLETSRNFYFLHTNYSEGEWNIDEENLVHNPLESSTIDF